MTAVIWRILTQSHLGLFVCLSSLFVVYPHLVHSSASQLLLDLLLSACILLSVIRGKQVHPFVHMTFVCVGVLATASTWLALFWPLCGPAVPVLYTLFFGLAVLIFFRALIPGHHVDSDTLLGAACTYILIGLFFASANAILLLFNPDCILLSQVSAGPDIYHLIYYSFMTLTTVGYGDILPMTHATRMLAAYEALVGQIFVAIVVGLLVGSHIARRNGAA